MRVMRLRSSPASDATSGNLTHYNTGCAHTGRHTKGRVPADVVPGARKWEPDDDNLARLLRLADSSRQGS